MTRKHYIAMAESLRVARPLWPHADFERFSDPEAQAKVGQWQADVRAIADVFAQDNGNFDRGRFYAACGLRS